MLLPLRRRGRNLRVTALFLFLFIPLPLSLRCSGSSREVKPSIGRLIRERAEWDPDFIGVWQKGGEAGYLLSLARPDAGKWYNSPLVGVLCELSYTIRSYGYRKGEVILIIQEVAQPKLLKGRYKLRDLKGWRIRWIPVHVALEGDRMRIITSGVGDWSLRRK